MTAAGGDRRRRTAAPTKTAATVVGGRGLGGRVGRSAYFARREAAKVLRSVLQGDARGRAVASIKTLVYGPYVRNKRATFALVCQTLKCLPLIKDILATTDAVKGKWKRQVELLYVIAYDILFGQDIISVGAAEKFLLLRKNALQSALGKLCVKEKVPTPEELLDKHFQPPDSLNPRYVRVNLLKMDTQTAIQELSRVTSVKTDEIVPDLLVLPSGVDLHDHQLVKNGSIFLQGKASSMVAVALGPEPGWEVIDACSAPGNKTVHLAALMKGKGKIIACELNESRIRCLEETVERSGATNIEVLHGDFLSLSPKDPAYLKVRSILLDPSCSGSGTTIKRLDHLLPSNIRGTSNTERLEKLSAFQKKALAHALSFPSVQRVVYSTCSINQMENEDVVQSVLPQALSLGFQLIAPFPRWERRGLPLFEGSEKLLRTDMAKDMEGFFIALFQRNAVNVPKKTLLTNSKISVPKDHDQIYVMNDETKLQQNEGLRAKKKILVPLPLKMSYLLLQRRIFPNIRRHRKSHKH